jgi:hypothetical protein
VWILAGTRGVQELDQAAAAEWSVVEHRPAWQYRRHACFTPLYGAPSFLTLVAPKHRSEDAAQIEIFILRHQLQVLRRQVKRPVYRHGDRALLAAASRILPKQRWGAFLVRPETLLRWHRSLVARKWTRAASSARAPRDRSEDLQADPSDGDREPPGGDT